MICSEEYNYMHRIKIIKLTRHWKVENVAILENVQSVTALLCI